MVQEITIAEIDKIFRSKAEEVGDIEGKEYVCNAYIEDFIPIKFGPLIICLLISDGNIEATIYYSDNGVLNIVKKHNYRLRGKFMKASSGAYLFWIFDASELPDAETIVLQDISQEVENEDINQEETDDLWMFPILADEIGDVVPDEYLYPIFMSEFDTNDLYVKEDKTKKNTAVLSDKDREMKTKERFREGYLALYPEKKTADTSKEMKTEDRSVKEAAPTEQSAWDKPLSDQNTDKEDANTGGAGKMPAQSVRHKEEPGKAEKGYDSLYDALKASKSLFWKTDDKGEYREDLEKMNAMEKKIPSGEKILYACYSTCKAGKLDTWEAERKRKNNGFIKTTFLDVTSYEAIIITKNYIIFIYKDPVLDAISIEIRKDYIVRIDGQFMKNGLLSAKDSQIRIDTGNGVIVINKYFATREAFDEYMERIYPSSERSKIKYFSS